MKKATEILNIMFITFICCTTVSCISSKNEHINPEGNEHLNLKGNEILSKLEACLEFSLEQYKILLSNLSETDRYPRSLENNNLVTVSASDWTSGFFPGSLWLLYDYTNNKFWQEKAQAFTENLESQKNNSNHDLGFMLYCSFGNGLRLMPNDRYEKTLLQAAATLSERFNANTGCIRSWDFGTWEFPVIIDNMMNLELLFWAAKKTGDQRFYNTAVKHAETTLKNHFRNNYSSYHLVNYDNITGNVISKETFQGAFHESSWARGQAWGLYGFTMVYRETGDQKFLSHAMGIADYMIKNLPEDYVFKWDFNVSSNEPSDASASAIMASALIELSSYDDHNKEVYLSTAHNILLSLSSEKYLAKKGELKGFLLKHSTGHKSHNSEIDVPLIYADYYFIEAIMRYIGNNKSLR